jgi:hypothetical protein
MAMSLAQADAMSQMQRTQDAVLTRLEQFDGVMREIIESGEVPGGDVSAGEANHGGAA